MEKLSHSGSKGWEKDIKQAYAYFSKTTENSGLRCLINEVLQKGQKREPQEKHIFVHPEFAWNQRADVWQSEKHRDVVAHDAHTYTKRIARLLRKHPSSTVLTYPNAREDFADLPYDEEQTILTPNLGHKTRVQGMLDKHTMRILLERFDDGICEDDRILIHGAATNACPRAFARQLLGIISFRFFFSPLTQEDSPTNPRKLHSNTLLTCAYHASYIPKHTQLRNGIQHNTKNVPIMDRFTEDMNEKGTTQIFPKRPYRGLNF